MEPANIAVSVSNLDEAKAQYAAILGVEPYAASEYYVGFRANGFELGLTGGTAGSPITYVPVDDLDAAVEAARAAGTVAEEAHDVGGGMRVAVFVDSDGNRIGLKAAHRRSGA